VESKRKRWRKRPKEKRRKGGKVESGKTDLKMNIFLSILIMLEIKNFFYDYLFY